MVKQHNQTGLKYFCKTTRKDPYKYLGSGKYWKRHLAVHGNDITTIWCHLYFDKDELVDDALAFSRSHNIVTATNYLNKKIWANEIPENGLDGGNTGPRSEETKMKISAAVHGRKYSEKICAENSARKKEYFLTNPGHMTGKSQSAETKRKISESEKGKVLTQETRAKMSVAAKGRIVTDSTREKLRNKVISPETRKKLAAASKRVWAERKAKKSDTLLGFR
jgi:plasmid stability protein